MRLNSNTFETCSSAFSEEITMGYWHITVITFANLLAKILSYLEGWELPQGYWYQYLSDSKLHSSPLCIYMKNNL